MLGQHLVAAVGGSGANLFGCERVGQVPGADDLHPVGKHKEPDGSVGEKVAVHQRIDQQLHKRFLRYLKLAQAVKTLVTLHMVQVALDEGQAALVLLFE